MWRIVSFFLILVFAGPTSADAGKWSNIHRAEEEQWATKTHTSRNSIRQMVSAAGLQETDDFNIENLDLIGLRERGQVLLATWDAGTGHCLTVYVLRANGKSGYKKLFEADQDSNDQNFCSQSVLGAAHAYTSMGAVVVEMPIDSGGGSGNPFTAPATVDLLCSTFTWNGEIYKSSGSTRISVPGNKYSVKSSLCGIPAKVGAHAHP